MTLILSGVAYSASGTPWWRKALMILVAVNCFVLTSVWQLVVFLPVVVTAVVALGSIALFVFLIVTGKRQRSGVERFVFAIRQFAQCAAEPGEQVDSLVYDWSQVNHVDMKRISPVWYRVRLGYRHPSHRYMSNIVLDIGIRCPDAEADAVLGYLQHHAGM